MNHSRTHRLVALTTTVAAVATLVLAACGSSSNTSSTSTSAAAGAAGGSGASPSGEGSSAARSKFEACLKSHGVTLPPRPSGVRRPNGAGGGGYGAGGPGFFGGGGSGAAGAPGSGAGRFNDPKLRAAIQACGGGQSSRQRFTPTRAAVTKFVACVKQHGYNLPTPNFSGKGPIFPAGIARNKKFQAASRACASDLRAPGTPAPGSSSAGANGGSSSD